MATKKDEFSEVELERPIDRTPGIPGSNKNQNKTHCEEGTFDFMMYPGPSLH